MAHSDGLEKYKRHGKIEFEYDLKKAKP